MLPPPCYIPEGEIPLNLDLGTWKSPEGDADAWTLIAAYACEYPRVEDMPPRYLERITDGAPSYLALAYRSAHDTEAVAVFVGEDNGVMSCLFNVITDDGASRKTAQAFILSLAEGGCWIASVERANPPGIN